MRLTVVGSSASYAGPGQACSGYLVTTGTARVLMDCGNGSLANAAKVVDPRTLDAVFVTHRHPDHFLDLFSLQALLRYDPSGPKPERMRVLCPEGLPQQMEGLFDERGRADMHEAFRFETIVAGAAQAIGDLTVTPLPADHIPGTFALRVASAGGTLCYTSDSRPGELVRAAAEGADVLLAEATLPEEYAGLTPHMTASEAGALAMSVGAGRLVLTHLWPATDRAVTLAGARATFGGEVILAEEMLTIEVP